MLVSEAERGLRLALSQPITAAVSPADEKSFRLMLDLAVNLRPLAADETQALEALASTLTPIFSRS